MSGSYELSPEMQYQVRNDLTADAQQLLNLVQRGGIVSSQVALEYRDIEQLRYIVKQMEMKVRLLGGWTS